MRILVVSDYYLPGFKAGGPIRSLSNLVTALGEEFQFCVLTGDRDLLSSVPYEDVEAGHWITRGEQRIIYLPPKQRRFRGLLHAARSADGFELVYLNSFFSLLTIRILLLRFFQLLPKVPFVVAPRGEFSQGALSLKASKKGPYLAFAKRSGLLRGIRWHATSGEEAEDIRRVIGGKAQVHIAPNLTSQQDDSRLAIHGIPEKEPGHATFVFLSRISPKKNLDTAIRLLGHVEGNAWFDIYGPLEDLDYWELCEAEMRKLPPNVLCRYAGTVSPECVQETLRRYHFFFMPTLGENFGHAIVEALVAGVPVIISDKTPWRNLSTKEVGWDISPDSVDGFVTVLNHCTEMDMKAYEALAKKARCFGVNIRNNPLAIEQSKALFRSH